MKFFKYFFSNNVFEIALLVWSALTAIYLMIRPADKPAALKEIEEMEKNRV